MFPPCKLHCTAALINAYENPIYYWNTVLLNKDNHILIRNLHVQLEVIILFLTPGFYSCTNIMTKKQVGEEMLYSAHTSTQLFITKGSKQWNSSRSGSRSRCRGHGEMFLTGLLPLACTVCSLTEPNNSKKWYHSQGAFPPGSLIEKMTHSWISWRHFPTWSSFSYDNSSLSQVDTQNKPVNTLCEMFLFSAKLLF